MASMRSSANMQASTQPQAAGGAQRKQPKPQQQQMAPPPPIPPAQIAPFQPLPQAQSPQQLAQPLQTPAYEQGLGAPAMGRGAFGGGMPGQGMGLPTAPGLQEQGGIPPGLLQILQQLKGGF